MKRVFERLNEMSFVLPKGYSVSTDKYNLPNGQGFINTENYLSINGNVLSFFEIYRNANEFFESYDSVYKDQAYSKNVKLEKTFKLRLGEYVFPIYILNFENEKKLYTVQVFIDCGDCLGCIMFQIDKISSDLKTIISQNKIFQEVVKLLRSVE